MVVDDEVRTRLRQAAGPVDSRPDLDAIAARVRGRRVRLIAGAAVLLLLPLVAMVVSMTGGSLVLLSPDGDVAPGADGATDAPRQPELPGDGSEAAYHPDRIRVRPEEVRAGDEVEVSFPQGSTRGYTFWLERRREVGFHPPEWFIEPDFAQVDQGHEVPRYAPATEPFGTADGDVFGPGPDLVRVPPEAVPGEYRLCAAWDGEVMCARLVVAD